MVVLVVPWLRILTFLVCGDVKIVTFLGRERTDVK